MAILCDSNIAGKLSLDVDRTRFATVRRYFQDPNTEIFHILFVSPNTSLDKVAAVFTGSFGDGALAKAIIRSLFDEGSIRLGVEDSPANKYVDHPQIMSIDLIDDGQPCSVLYCPPIYFVQLVE